MTMRSAPEWMQDPIDMGDLLPEIVLAALYDVAGSPGMGTLDSQHSADPMTVEEARARIDAAGGEISEDWTRGRVMKLASEGRYLDVFGYNRDNGDGRPLAQAIIEHLRGEFSSATPSSYPDADRLCAQARIGAAELGLALVWRNTSVHTPRFRAEVAGAVFQACATAGIESRGDALMALDHGYPIAVRAWTLAEVQTRTQGGDPVAHLESAIDFWESHGEGSNGVDPLLRQLLATARRETAAGRTWADMPEAFEAALVEYAVAAAVPTRGSDSGTIPPLGKR